MITTWNPQRYLTHFGTAEHMASILGIQPRAMRQQIIKKKINEKAKAYLDNITGFNQPNLKKPQKRSPQSFVVGEITNELIEAIKTHGTKYKLSYHYGVRTQRLNAHLVACFGHHDLQKIREMILAEPNWKPSKPHFEVGVLDKDFLEAIKQYNSKCNLVNYYGVKFSTLNDHLVACFGHHDFHKIKGMFK